jgi:hypothetical protein
VRLAVALKVWIGPSMFGLEPSMFGDELQWRWRHSWQAVCLFTLTVFRFQLRFVDMQVAG